MPHFHSRRLLLTLCVSLLILVSGTLAGCGGSSGGSGPGGGPFPLFVFASTENGGTVEAWAVDPTTGELSFVGEEAVSAAAGAGPSGIALHPSGRFLYTSNVLANSATALGVDEASGQPTRLAEPVPTGDNARSVVVRPGGAEVLVAAAGRIARHAILPDGTLGSETDVDLSTITTSALRRIVSHPNGRFVYATAESDGLVVAVDLDDTSGEGHPIGDGPWDLAIDPAGDHLFAVARFDAQVHVFEIDDATKALTEIAASPFSLPGDPNAIAVAPGGWVYVTDNDNGTTSSTVRTFDFDSVAGTFAAVVGSERLVGAQARSATIDQSGRFLYVGSGFGTLSAFAIDLATGLLTEVPGSPVSTGDIAALETVTAFD